MNDETMTTSTAINVSTPKEGCAVIRTGRVIDERNAESLINRVRELSESGIRFIIFDCTQLEYITSFGLSVFLRTRKIMREAYSDTTKVRSKTTENSQNGKVSKATDAPVRVRLSSVASHVLDVLRTACLLEILPVFDDVEAAMAPVG